MYSAQMRWFNGNPAAKPGLHNRKSLSILCFNPLSSFSKTELLKLEGTGTMNILRVVRAQVRDETEA